MGLAQNIWYVRKLPTDISIVYPYTLTPDLKTSSSSPSTLICVGSRMSSEDVFVDLRLR